MITETNLNLNAWLIIAALAIFIGHLSTIYLITKKQKNRAANTFLGLFILCISIILASNFVILSELYLYIPHLIGISFPFWFILGQLFYFYVIYTTDINRTFKWHDLLHLFPFIYNLISLLSFYTLESQIKLSWLQQFLEKTPELSAQGIIIVLMGACYLTLSISRLIIFQRMYKNELSNTQIELFRGVKRLTIVYVIYFGLDFIAFLSSNLASQSTIETLQFMSIALTLFIFVTAYTVINEPDLLFAFTSNTKRKYQTSNLTENLIDDQAKKLLKLMEEKKPFLDPNLKLDELAVKLGITKHALSQIINQYFKQNYYDFINQYRVREVQKRLINPEYQKQTILSIAFDTGFNSKSAFNKIFKSISGMSPSQYIKSANEKTAN